MKPDIDSELEQYLRNLGGVQPTSERLARARAVRPNMRSRRPRLRGPMAVGLVGVCLVGGIATGAGLTPWDASKPAADEGGRPAPTDALRALGAFRTPAVNEPRAAINDAVRRLGSPWTVYDGSVRLARRSFTGGPVFLMYAAMREYELPEGVTEPPGAHRLSQGVYVDIPGAQVGSAGPFSVSQIQAGTAFVLGEMRRPGSTAAGSGRVFTAIVPDGVARVRLDLRNGWSKSFDVRNNVVNARVDPSAGDGAPETLTMLGEDGSVIRVVTLA